MKDTILLRDIVKRKPVRDVRLLDDIFIYLVNNASNLFSVQHIVNFFKSKNRKVSYDTLSNYLGYIEEAFLAYKTERYNIKGKDVVAGNCKYYLNDLSVIGNLLNPMGWGEGLKHFIPALFLLHPFVPRMDYFFYFDSPSWSLGCEQLFYFLFPFLALFFAKKQKLIGALLVCAVVVPVLMSMTDETNIRGYWYVNPLARFPDFLVGMLLYRVYEWCRSKKLSFSTASLLEVGVVCIFLLFYMFSADLVPKVYRYSCYYWMPISLVLLIFSLQKGFLSRILSNKYLVIGGDISIAFI